MTLQVWFWAIYVLSILFGGYRAVTVPDSRSYWLNTAVYYILIGLLGLQVFGGPLKG
jgi:hypothetical protein